MGFTGYNEYVEKYKKYLIVKKYSSPANYSIMYYSNNIRRFTSWLESLECIIKTGNSDMNLVSKKIKELGGYYEPFVVDNGFPTLEQAREFIDWLETLEIMIKIMED